jgi:hypothetical protein
MQNFSERRWPLVVIAAIALAFAPIQAQAAIVIYSVNMNGPSEAPPNASPGIGSGTVTFDTFLNTMDINLNFSGLTGNTTAAHIHAATANAFAGTAGVATTLPTFVGFPLGVTSGSFISSIDLTLASSFSAAYVTAQGGTIAQARAALLTAAADGKAYFNVHTGTFPGGEIRGFLTAVPEPSGLLLSGWIVGVALLHRRPSRKS